MFLKAITGVVRGRVTPATDVGHARPHLCRAARHPPQAAAATGVEAEIQRAALGADRPSLGPFTRVTRGAHRCEEARASASASRAARRVDVGVAPRAYGPSSAEDTFAVAVRRDVPPSIPRAVAAERPWTIMEEAKGEIKPVERRTGARDAEPPLATAHLPVAMPTGAIDPLSRPALTAPAAVGPVAATATA